MRSLAPNIRIALLGALIVLVVLVTSACSVIRPYAARVNGEEISEEALHTELETILDNGQYLESLELGGDRVRGDGQSTFTASFVARLLTVRVLLELVHQAVEERDLDVPSSVRALAERDVVEQVGGPEVLQAFPDSYRRQLVKRTSEVTALQLDLAGLSLGDDAIRDFYDESPELFAESCISHILLTAESAGVPADQLRAEADRVRTQLLAGADFATVARERSADQGSAQAGGELGCARPGRYVEEFETAAAGLAVGEISPPVETQFGLHLIRVTERRQADLDDVADEVRQRILSEAQDELSRFLQERLGEADIKVNPRYGTFDRSSGQPQVVPPRAPSGAGQRPNRGSPPAVPTPLP